MGRIIAPFPACNARFRVNATPTAPASGPNCNACAHYYITHDPRFPYGCRKLNFKSKRLPALDVLTSSGLPCMVFKPKGRSR